MLNVITILTNMIRLKNKEFWAVTLCTSDTAQYFGGTINFEVLLPASVGLFFDTEDGGGMFHQMQNHTVLQPRRTYSSHAPP
jgi:hypothetical protein